MKRYIRGAVTFGTRFFKIPIDVLKKAAEDENILLKTLIDEEGWGAINIDGMYGSKVIGDTLYYCETDGEPIQVNGQEVDPEEALEEFQVDDLSDFIYDPSEDEIKKMISEYDIMPFDIDAIAEELITSHKATFYELYQAYKEFEKSQNFDS